MNDVIIIGAGIFGSIINKTLKEHGFKTMLLDAELPESGSPPAGCLMKPGWLSGFSKGEQLQIYQHLTELYGIETIKFSVYPSGLTTKIWHVSPWKIMGGEYKPGEVVNWERHSEFWYITTDNPPYIYETRHVVFATGIWAAKQFDIEEIKPRKGVSFFIPKRQVPHPFVDTWAPYKQIVAFNMDYGIWTADGTSLKPESFTRDRIKQSCKRCLGALEDICGVKVQPEEAQFSVGIRPYYKKGQYLLLEKEPGLWIATGGGKNGTAAAALCSLEILQALRAS